MNKKPKLKVFLDLHRYPSGTFHDVLQTFLIKQSRRGLSEYSVIHLYGSLWPLGEWLGNPQLMTITPRHLLAYRDDLFLRYSPGTIRPMIGDIKQFLAWCKKKQYIAKNPAKRLTKPRPRRAKDKAAPETAVRAVIAYLVGQMGGLVYRDIFGQLQCAPGMEWGETDLLALRDLFCVAFLYETGGRARELTKLGAMTMQRACQEKQQAYTVTSIGKTNDRDLRFTEVTAELWRLWYAVRPSGCADYAVFSMRPTHPPAPLTSNGVSQILARRCREADTAVFRAHALRHAKVRRSRRLVGLEMASVLLDHSTVEMTANYANVEDGEVIEAVNRTGIQGDLWSQKTPD